MRAWPLASSPSHNLAVFFLLLSSLCFSLCETRGRAFSLLSPPPEQPVLLRRVPRFLAFSRPAAADFSLERTWNGPLSSLIKFEESSEEEACKPVDVDIDIRVDSSSAVVVRFVHREVISLEPTATATTADPEPLSVDCDLKREEEGVLFVAEEQPLALAWPTPVEATQTHTQTHTHTHTQTHAPIPSINASHPMTNSLNESTMPLPVSTTASSSSSAAPRTLFFGMSSARVIQLVWYYFLLYFFTVVYNVANKKVLEFFPLPATVSAIQTLIGIPLFLPIWFMKPPRNLDSIDRSSLMKIALCHGLGNLATLYALLSGTISFTHVVKSAEPLFSALLSLFITKTSLSIPVYLSLIPIVCGVGIASAKEMSFTWFGFIAAMSSNFFYQLRMVLSKQSFQQSEDSNKLSAANTFRVITIFSLIQLIPLAWILEGHQIAEAVHAMLAHPKGLQVTLLNLLIAGFSFYVYNEIGFWILDLVHPVTHAVGNTIKRVVLVAASIIIFHNPVSNLGLIGSIIAIAGSFWFALASQKR